MISYERDTQQTIPESSVKIIGLGGAGANMLDRIALDGMTGAEMLSINTDIRTLNNSAAKEKIQIGKNLTKGLGSGGDPEVGLHAAQESEMEIRDALRDRKMVFLCIGLGGGTGSGAAPLICRLAREEGALVVVFATMPFTFEGARRREQADTALNELAVLANALVTFDNNRMGELVVAKQGIHEAFSAADVMIAESVKAVTRIVLRPGLVNIGLDELMTVLQPSRSRCLFGSGIAQGENRIQTALENALSSPLLDRGSLLEAAKSVLVHICGGDSMTLYEVELLMQSLSKHIPESAHLLFGVSVDSAMNDNLSITVISSLPETQLMKPEETAEELPIIDVISEEEEVAENDNLLETDSTIEPEETDPEEEAEEEEIFKTKEEANEEIIKEETEAEEQQEDQSTSLSDTTPPINTKAKNPQGELELGSAPKGKFEGETPNVLNDEDLDIPPFLRQKRN